MLEFKIKKRLNLYPIVKITFVENKSGDGVRGKKKRESNAPRVKPKKGIGYAPVAENRNFDPVVGDAST